jgi:hypothetical protein
MRVTLAVLSVLAPVALMAQRAPSTAQLPTLRGARVIALEASGVPLELASLAGVRVARNGGVLFADSKPVTVRLRAGAPGGITQVAREGAGPGEFRAAPEFVGYRGDSIAAFDARLRRWSILSPTGSFVRVLGTGAESDRLATAAAWVGKGALVFNASIDDGRPPLAPVVSAVAAHVARELKNPGQPIVIRQAGNGDLWAAPTIFAKTWRVFDRAGRPRFVATFERPFQFQFANDTVAIGQSTDEDDLPQLLSLSLRGAPAARGNAPTSPNSPNAAAADDHTGLTTLLKQLMMKQEAAYADSSRYTTTVSRLRVDVPAGVQLTILYANNRGWFAMATNVASGTTCAMGVGFSLVIGWTEGAPYCSK